VAVGCRPDRPRAGGRLLDRQPGEVTQFDHLGRRILGIEPGEGCIQGEQFFVCTFWFRRDIS